MVQGQLSQGTIQKGALAHEKVPATPVGYDELDALVLNQPELHRLLADQQRAIADWVRAGGTLVIWPGEGPMPTSGPISEILPCTIGDNGYLQLDPAALKEAGLPPRF